MSDPSLSAARSLVVVTWEDTTNVAAWQTIPEAADMTGWLVQNVGWVVHEDDDCVVVAARQAFAAEPPQVGLAERIPKRAIIARETL